QQAIDFFLVSKGQWAQLRWQSKGDEKVGAGQETRLLLRQPALSLVSMTLGAVPVAAGVIGIDLPAAVVTLFQMAAKVGRTTCLDISQRPLLTGQQALLGAIGRTMAAADLRHLHHCQTSARVQRSSIRWLSGSVTVARTSRVRCV